MGESDSEDEGHVSTLLVEIWSLRAVVRTERTPCVLVGHNMKALDASKLVHIMKPPALQDELKECVVEFADALPAFRKKIPKYREDTYKQETLVKDLVGEKYSYDDVLYGAHTLHEHKYRMCREGNPPETK